MLTDATTPTYAPTRDVLNATPRAEIRMVGGDDAAKDDFSLVGDGKFTFWDFLDVINPLQHIPLVNTVYREITGDTIKPVMKLAGGALFGGPLGLGIAALDVGVEGTTGKDTGQHVAAMFDGVDDPRGTAYRLYNEAAANENGWRDNSEALAQAERMIAALDRRDAPAQVADADIDAALTLPALTVVPAAALPEAETAEAEAELPAAWAAPPAAGSVSGRLHEAKEFPMPERRHTGAPKTVAEVRAGRGPSATVPAGVGEVAPGLSPAAMEAAGLTPEAVQEVLRAHGQGKAEDTALAAVQPAAAQPARKAAAARPAPAAGESAEPLWFFDRMNTALDKYRAAQGLAPAAAAQ